MRCLSGQHGAGEMVQQVKASASESDDPSSVSLGHMQQMERN